MGTVDFYWTTAQNTDVTTALLMKPDRSCTVAGYLSIFDATALAVRGVRNESCWVSCIRGLAEKCPQVVIAWFTWTSF